MINNQMNNYTSEQKGNRRPSGKPNEVGGIYFSSIVKIFDPNSQEVMVQKRGDD